MIEGSRVIGSLNVSLLVSVMEGLRTVDSLRLRELYVEGIGGIEMLCVICVRFVVGNSVL